MKSHADFTTTAAKLTALIEQSALSNPGGDPKWLHSDLHLSMDGGFDEALVSLNNYKSNSVLTYNSFDQEFFDEIDGAVDVVFDAEKMLNYLRVASDGGRMRVDFLAPEDATLAEQIQAEGALEMGVSTKASQSALDIAPQDLPDRFDEDDNFLSPSGNTHETFIETTAEQVQKIIEAVELEEGDEFPVVVEDGEFRLDVGENLDFQRGGLAGVVEGEDVANDYRPGFKAVFDNTLSGDVKLQLTQDQAMAVIKETEAATYRHVLAPV